MPLRSARCHIFYSQRVVDIPDGKPKWSKMDGVSQLVDDVGDLKEVESVVSKEKLEKAGREAQEKDRKERREKAAKEGKNLGEVEAMYEVVLHTGALDFDVGTVERQREKFFKGMKFRGLRELVEEAEAHPERKI